VPEPEVSAELGFRRLLAVVARICVGRWPALLLAGLMIFIPLGLVDVFGYDELEFDDEADVGTVIIGLLGLGLGVIAALVGEALYAGVVAGLVVAEREGREPSVIELLGRLPLRRLLAVDLLAALVIAAGFVALIVPGLLFVAWFALVAPAVEVEKLGVVAAFRRSRELVRGHVWFVLVLVLPLLIAEAAISDAAQSASFWGLGHGFAGDWLGAVLGNLLTSPFYAIAVTVLFFELRARR
jgi:hypothetical protein